MLSWKSDDVASMLGWAMALAWVWMVVSYLRAPHNLRRILSYGGDPLHESLRWKGLVLFAVSIMCVSYNFVKAANTGVWPAADYRNSDGWILANQVVVLLVGPALIVGGVALWLRRWRRMGR